MRLGFGSRLQPHGRLRLASGDGQQMRGYKLWIDMDSTLAKRSLPLKFAIPAHNCTHQALERLAPVRPGAWAAARPRQPADRLWQHAVGEQAQQTRVSYAPNYAYGVVKVCMLFVATQAERIAVTGWPCGLGKVLLALFHRYRSVSHPNVCTPNSPDRVVRAYACSPPPPGRSLSRASQPTAALCTSPSGTPS